MKTMSVGSVRELLRAAEYTGWYQRYKSARSAIEGARVRREDLLSQAHMVRYKAELTQQTADERLFAAGEFEDLAARANAEFVEIENNSFEVLSAFELQRQQAIDAISEHDRSEKLLEDERQLASELRARADAAKKHKTPEGQAEAERLESRLREVEIRVQALGKAEEEAEERRGREGAKKQDLWLDVEAAWSSSFRANMARTEFAYEGRRVRTESEELFARASAERRRVEELEAEAERMVGRVAELEREYDLILEEGRRAFDCALINEFLYWPHADDVKAALCVPLIDESKHFNI